MSVVTDKIGKSLGYGRGRQVSVERDGIDFVVAFQPEGHVIFRHHDLKALRQVCSKLRWEVIEEKSFPLNLNDIRTVSERIRVRQHSSAKPNSENPVPHCKGHGYPGRPQRI
jgi:hypothetical protein